MGRVAGDAPDLRRQHRLIAAWAGNDSYALMWCDRRCRVPVPGPGCPGHDDGAGQVAGSQKRAMPRTIAEQTVEELGGRDSVLARQRRGHVEMDRMMDEYQVLPDGEDRERVLKEIVQLVFSHAFAEETVLWPAVRRFVAEGQELTSRVEDEHQQINGLVADIERLEPADPEREQKVQQVFALIRQDIRDEEDLLLPRLQDTLDGAQLRRLGAGWETVRRTAPTHPHPVVPRRPPGNAVLGVPLSLFDRARDALGVGSSAATAKKVLGALAGLFVAVTWGVVRLRQRR